MGREQGDHLPKNPELYVGEVNGEVQERPAYTPADHVNLRAAGWVPKNEKRGGKHAPVVAAPSPRVDAGATPSSNG